MFSFFLSSSLALSVSLSPLVLCLLLFSTRSNPLVLCLLLFPLTHVGVMAAAAAFESSERLTRCQVARDLAQINAIRATFPIRRPSDINLLLPPVPELFRLSDSSGIFGNVNRILIPINQLDAQLDETDRITFARSRASKAIIPVGAKHIARSRYCEFKLQRGSCSYNAIPIPPRLHRPD